ncbi:hypothetical protein Tco_0914295, partial [Tanacetum coccineum]
LAKKVKKLEDILKRRHVLLTDSEDDEPEDQGRIFQDINDDHLVSKGDFVASQRSKSVDKGKRYKRRKESKGKDVDTGFEDISSGFEEVNTETQAPKRTKEQIQQEEASLAEAIRLQTLKEEETAKQVHLDALLAKRLAEEEELTEQQKKRKAQVQFEAQFYNEEDWDAIRAKLKANAELTKGKDLSEQDFAKIMSPQGDSETDKEESVEAMNPTPLDTKSNIVANWKIFQQGERSIYQIIRANGADTVYMSFEAMVKDFTKEDLIELYRLVMQKYGINRPGDAYDRVLWSDLRTMFDPPLDEDVIWSLPLQQKMISWRYYDKCAVDYLTLEACNIYMYVVIRVGHDIYMWVRLLQISRRDALNEKRKKVLIKTVHPCLQFKNNSSIDNDFANSHAGSL